MGSLGNKTTCVCLIFFIILTMILFVILLMMLLGGGFSMESDVCETPQCLRIASSLLDSIDTSVDPCDDFNQFVCGRWGQRHIMPDTLNKNSWFVESRLFMEKRIGDFLKKGDSSHEPEAVHKARRLFRACNDLDAMAENGVVSLRNLLVNDVGLPLIPPIGDKPKQSWIRSVALAKKNLDLDIILGFTMGQLPSNKSVIKLLINTPTKGHIYSLLRKEMRVESEQDETTQFVLKPELVKFLKFFPSVTEDVIPDLDEKLDKAADDILFVMKGLTALESDEHVMKATQNIKLLEYTLKDLQEYVDNFAKGGKSKIKFRQYFQTIFEGVNDKVNLDLDGADTILVANDPFFMELSQFLDSVTEQQIELYIWFEIVYNFARHTNLNLAILKRRIDEAGKTTGITELRDTFCIRTTTALMKPAVIHFMFEDPNIEEKRTKAHKMLMDIKESFLSHLEGITWMDQETKIKAGEKAAGMETYVAYLDKLRNKSIVDDDFKNVKIVQTAYLNSLRKLLKDEVKNNLLSLRKLFDVEMLGFEMTDINAYYNPNANNIFLPAGILQYPFYDLGLEALNYGSIGVILGHEITHGFDDTGKKYDKEGNLYDWWSEESDEEYEKRTKCYIHKYGNYTVERANKTIDGALTLGENIADDGGLNEAFLAYKKWVRENGEEKKLPGFGNYTHEQLFFISFAHTWCADYRDMDTLVEDFEDAHTPEPARAVITLRNFEEFANAWSCPKGTIMNPTHERCKMWVD